MSTTHAVIWYPKYTGQNAVMSWMVASVNTDQIVHLLLAMADDKIKATGDDKVRVTVRKRRGEGAVQFVDVNRIYEALRDKPRWDYGGGGHGCPQWLVDHEGQAKVVLFVVTYFLGGCCFLPAF